MEILSANWSILDDGLQNAIFGSGQAPLFPIILL